MLMAPHERPVVEEATRMLTSMHLGAYGKAERTREQDASHTVLAHHKSTDETLLLSCSIEVVQPLDLMSFIYVKSS